MTTKTLTLNPDRIREIRRAAGLTQHQFASEIGVGKVTVARWESGSRKCRSDYAKRVLKLAAAQATKSTRSTTLFDIDAKALQSLDSKLAVEAFRNLLWAECSRLRVPCSEVHIGTREIADEGIDAIVPRLEQSAKSDSFLEEGANYFQIKAGPSWKPWQPSFARKELLGKRKRLGEAIQRCLSECGRYVLVSFGTDLTPNQRQDARRNIETVFADVGHADAVVDVWGQQELIGLFRRFPFLSLRLSRRGDLQFQSWSSWNMSNEMSTVLELGETQEQFCENIARLVRDSSVSHIRVIGEPGLGKTRLVHEALAADNLAPLVVYVPHAEDFQRSRLFYDLSQPHADYFAILVLDECRPRECAEIWDRLSRHSNRCTVLSLDHDSFQPGDQHFVELQCPRLGDEQLARIIQSYAGAGVGGSHWAGLCSGVPRVAHAIGRNLQTHPDDLLRAPSMDLLWQRCVSGYRVLGSTESRQKLTVLRHIALFQRFGFESPVEREGAFIAELAKEADPGITYGRFQEIVAELKSQRLLQGKTTLFIAPKLLHVHLWTQFWELHGRNQSIGSLIQRIPVSLISWFVRMFPYAGESRVALDHVKSVLGPEGPFSNPDFALSNVGCHFLHELANAAPEHTLSCLERVLGQASDEELLSFGQPRQQIVWALERIAVWPMLFYRAAHLLRRLAESENAIHSNNATGTFAGLFSLAPGRVAPTGASPEIRFPVLIETLNAASANTRRLGIRACRSAMDMRSAFRITGAEYQGLKTADLWIPDTWDEITWDEVHAARGRVWQILVDASNRWDSDLRADANGVLIESAWGLLDIPALSDHVLATLEDLADDGATDLQQLVRGITRIRRFRNDYYDSRVIDRLLAIDARVSGPSYSDRVRRIIHFSGWDDVYDETDRYGERFRQRVKGLAAEAAQSEDKFYSVLPGLVCGTNNLIYSFGHELARIDAGSHLMDVINAYRVATASVTEFFISGYLATVFDVDREKWTHVITDLLDDKAFKDIIGAVIRDAGGSDEVIFKLLDRYDSGALDVSCLRSLGYSRCLKELAEQTFLAFAQRVRAAGDIGFVVELFDYVYCAPDEIRRLPEAATMEVLRDCGRADSLNDGIDYHWSVVAERFAEQFPSRRIELLEAILDRVTSYNWFPGNHNHAYCYVRSIVQSEPDRCWETVSVHLDATDDAGRYRLFDWLGPAEMSSSGDNAGLLVLFPMNAVFDWIAEDPESRARDFVDAVPKTLSRDENGAWARELLNRYGDRPEVRRRLLSHFWSDSWCGKASDHYRSKRRKAREWLDGETSMWIRQWLEEYT